MRLLLCNGSPRGAGSNTALLLKQFTDGFLNSPDNSVESFYLKEVARHREAVEKIRSADAVIIAFPLYADSMPAYVKDFIETIGASGFRGDGMRPRIGYIVQSGFPEAIHSRFVERYLEKLARRLNMHYIGTVIKGGVEGIQAMPPIMTRRLFMAFKSLGRHFGVTREFHPIIMKKLAGADRLSPAGRALLRLMRLTGLANMYWNMMLKKHKAYDKRFDRPYAP